MKDIERFMNEVLFDWSLAKYSVNRHRLIL